MKNDKELHLVKIEIEKVMDKNKLTFGESIVLLESLKFNLLYELEWETSFNIDEVMLERIN